MRITRRLAAAAVIPFFALAACSGQGNTSGDNPTTDAAGNGTSAAPATPAEQAKDVEFTKCDVEDGTAQVGATVTNSGDAAANIIVAVEIQQDGQRVDGVGLIINGVEPGKTGTATERGTKTDLKGDIECVAASVNAVAS